MPLNLCLYLAHKQNEREQCVQEHLLGVAELTKQFATKVGLAHAGELIGLLHDLGKYSQSFQDYLRSALEEIDPDADEYKDPKHFKGKIDHSTAGAQLIWNTLTENYPSDPKALLIAQLLALCVVSHHSGLIDCLEEKDSGEIKDKFSQRINKSEKDAHLQEVLTKVDSVILDKALNLLADNDLVSNVSELIKNIRKNFKSLQKQKNITNDSICHFKQGLLLRFLFSCLIDADRIDTADFENPQAAKKRLRGRYRAFPILIERLETNLTGFSADNAVNKHRKQISDTCLERALDDQGIFTLSVPTGGGKTLASLRFALHHVEKHKLERIIYIIPFTSIIDQNAETTREILEPKGSGDEGNIVLEHHSNLTSELQTWKTKILSENWDAPVVYTTMVQFLETLFGAGTRGARRMHQLANAVLIFDEIQTLPINCVHLFNNVINFLVEHCHSTVVLCTATQPLLDKVDPSKGSLILNKNHELISDVAQLYQDLRRVSIINRCEPIGWTYSKIAHLAIEEMQELGSCLVIVNTKDAAKQVFQTCKHLLIDNKKVEIFHLSTSMCPAHRKAKLAKMKGLLKTELDEDINQIHSSIICISTQLIEAGVDVDFGAVIRSIAGLDSIAQAAGRCNRNGKRKKIGRVSIVNPNEEKTSSLIDIKKGISITERIFGEYRENPLWFDSGDLIGVTAMREYFDYYFYRRKNEMTYLIDKPRSDNLFNLLSSNSQATHSYERSHEKDLNIHFKQSFMTAAKAFKAIDTPTRGILVPYNERGQEIINALCAAYEPDKQYALLKEAQQYTVNVFPQDLKDLDAVGALHFVQKDVDILYLKKSQYYSKSFGLSTNVVEEESYSNFQML